MSPRERLTLGRGGSGGVLLRDETMGRLRGYVVAGTVAGVISTGEKSARTAVGGVVADEAAGGISRANGCGQMSLWVRRWGGR